MGLIQIHFFVFLAYLFFANMAGAESFDLSVNGPFCREAKAKHPEYESIFEPGWLNGREDKNPEISFACSIGKLDSQLTKIAKVQAYLERISMKQRMLELSRVSHDLNSYYLAYMVPAFYQRLASAKELGIDISKFQEDMAAFHERCNGKDASGRNLANEAGRYLGIIGEVNADFKLVENQVLGQEKYLRLLIVAALEQDRLERVISILESSLRFLKGQDADDNRQKLLDHQRRLLRLRFTYPALANFGSGSNQIKIQRLLEANFHLNRLSPPALTNAPEDLETVLKIAPLAEPPATLPALRQNERPMREGVYSWMYKDILSGKRFISEDLRTALKEAAEISVQKSIISLHMKCENPTPCMAIQVQPAFFSALLSDLQNGRSLAELACACNLDEKVGHMNNWQNAGIGLLSVGTAVLALKHPNRYTFSAAIAAFGLDLASSGIGIYDATMNLRRMDRTAALLAGGATDPLTELNESGAIRQSQFEYWLSLGAGVISVFPPGKITKEFAEETIRVFSKNPKFLKYLRSEAYKAVATSVPVPNLPVTRYRESWEPRRFIAPFPIEFRDKYPVLMGNLAGAMGQNLFLIDPELRDQFVLAVKKAIGVMTNSQDPKDAELLSQGILRKSALPLDNKAKWSTGLDLNFIQ